MLINEELKVMMVKNNLALQMVNRVLKSGIYADYLLVDSWYAKPNFIYEIKKKVLM